MLKLHSKNIKSLGPKRTGSEVFRITTNPNLPRALRGREALLSLDSTTLASTEDFFARFLFEESVKSDQEGENLFVLPTDLKHLGDGDVVRFDFDRLSLRILYRRRSSHNSLLLTERCNNFCLMCSQPPKEVDDSHIADDLLKAIPLMNTETRALTITGGEPTLLGVKLLTLLERFKSYMPNTAIHILSNGRTFKDLEFAESFGAINHPDLMLGIPVYSDISNIHDYVVQADGAFDETIKGILNLKRSKVPVEVRVVIHKQTFKRLPQLASFLVRNLLFVDHVALMGLEMMGFTRINLEDLWIDPVEYQKELVEAVEILNQAKMNVSIYNHQLCLLDPRIHRFSVRSISDWKNEYMPECEPCSRRQECGGFFSSAKLRYSSNIKPFSSNVYSEAL